MRLSLRFITLIGLMVSAIVLVSPAQAQMRSVRLACQGRPVPVLCDIHQHRNAVWHYETLLGQSHTPYGWTAERAGSSPAYRLWVRQRWYHRHLTWRVRYLHAMSRPWSAAWYADIMCIHGGEGAWNDETGNGYHGGLQMDGSFETTYGPEFYARWGNAGNWPPIDQIIAAWRAYSSGRGFTPWPNTGAACGL